jgi:hypothetical protein
MAQDWDPDQEQDTVFRVIEDTLAGTSVPLPSLEFKYGADDARHKTFSYDQTRKSIKVYNSPLHRDVSPHPMTRFFGPSTVLGSWLAESKIEALDLTGAGTCTTSASDLRNVYITPCFQYLKHLKHHRMQMRSISIWSDVLTLVSHAPVLKTCQLSNLASYEHSADRSQKATFLEVIFFEAEDYNLKRKLLDLTARLQAYEVTWRNEALDSPTKWTDELGAKVDSRVVEQEKATPIPQTTPTPHTTPVSQANPPVASELSVLANVDPLVMQSSRLENYSATHEMEEQLLSHTEETNTSTRTVSIETGVASDEEHLELQ